MYAKFHNPWTTPASRKVNKGERDREKKKKHAVYSGQFHNPRTTPSGREVNMGERERKRGEEEKCSY